MICTCRPSTSSIRCHWSTPSTHTTSRNNTRIQIRIETGYLTQLHSTTKPEFNTEKKRQNQLLWITQFPHGFSPFLLHGLFKNKIDQTTRWRWKPSSTLKSGPAHTVNCLMTLGWLLSILSHGKLVPLWCGSNEKLGLSIQACLQWDTFVLHAP